MWVWIKLKEKFSRLLLCSSIERFEFIVAAHTSHAYFVSLWTSICFLKPDLLWKRLGHFSHANALTAECLIKWLFNEGLDLNSLPHSEQRCAENRKKKTFHNNQNYYQLRNLCMSALLIYLHVSCEEKCISMCLFRKGRALTLKPHSLQIYGLSI